jgi:hypothetical protein
MAGVGGYQAPANPAPVSGPGALSQRTDGGPSQGAAQLPDAKYGEQAEFQELQQGAPMPLDTSDLTPLDAPTARPDEPVTAGAPVGEGPSDLPGYETPEDLMRVRDLLPALTILASMEGVSPATRQLVRQLRAGRGHIVQ